MRTTLKSSTSRSGLGEQPRVVLAKVSFVPRAHLWTPRGLVDLSEPHDLRDFKPCLLGTWNVTLSEPAPTHEVEDRPPRLSKQSLCLLNVD